MPKQYQIILDSVPYPMFAVDLDLRIFFINPALEKITQVSKKEAFGNKCADVLWADVCDRKQCLIRNTLEAGRSLKESTLHLLRKNKDVVSVKATTTLLKTPDGKVFGVLKTLVDLTSSGNLSRGCKYHFQPNMVTQNDNMRRIFSIVPRIALSKSTVLIEGASGTGKEVLARIIHENSLENKTPFVPVNCAALPDALGESELFGHKAGSFTGALKNRIGRFAAAENGTLFLDEIGDTSPAMQGQLLRVLEGKGYQELGSNKTIIPKCRVIAATHRNLKEMANNDKFRNDLYYRLNVVKIRLPSLAERKEDIPMLVKYFLGKFNHLFGKAIAKVDKDLMDQLVAYDWPGNIRELENILESAFIICDGKVLSHEHLQTDLFRKSKIVISKPSVTLEEVQNLTIKEALTKNNGKIMATARELGIDKNTLRRKMKRM